MTTVTSQIRFKWFGALIAAALVSPNLVWVWLDRRVWPWDQAWYGEVSSDLYFLLRRQPADWWNGMMTLMPSKPPLVSWVGQFFVPLGLRLGDVNVGLLMLSVIAQTASVYFVWMTIGALTADRIWACLAGALLVAAAPLFIGMSHQFVTEPLQTLIVIYSFYLLATCQRRSLPDLIITTGLAVGAGFAVKTTTIIYCGLAWLYLSVLIIAQLRRGKSMIPEGPMGYIGYLAMIIVNCSTLAWYYVNFGPMLAHVRDALSTDMTLDYGRADSFFNKMIYWNTSFNESIFILSNVFLIIIIIGVVSLLIRFITLRTTLFSINSLSDINIVVGFFALLHLLYLFFQMSAQIMEESRFLSPIIPVLALAVVVNFGVLTARNFPFYIISGCLAAQLALVQLQSFNVVTGYSNSSWLLGVQPSKIDETVLDDIVADTCTPDDERQYIVTGVEQPFMNANSADFEVAKARLAKGYRCYYTSLGYAETDAQRALKRIDSLRSPYVISQRPEDLDKNPNFLNKAAAGVERLIRERGDFVEVNRSFGRFIIYKRVDP